MKTIEDRLSEATRDVHRAVATLPQNTIPDALRRVAPVTAVVISVAAVVLLGLALIVLPGGPGQRDATQLETVASGPEPAWAETSSPPSGGDDGEIPANVLDYWALDGTLESVVGEEGWLCPARGPERHSSAVEDAEMPPELKVEIPGLEPIDVLNGNYGPVCHQPPLLAMLASTGEDSGLTVETGLAAEAGMAVWPEVSRFEDVCPPAYCGIEGTVEELSVNNRPARLQLHTETDYEIWWFDWSGTPLYARSSGLDREQVLELIESIHVDPAVQQATVNPETLGELKMFVDQASAGAWQPGYRRTVTYDIEGTEVAITTRYDASFDPHAGFASGVDFLSLVEVNDTLAQWIPEGGNHLFYTTANGVLISIQGTAGVDEAISVAEQIRGQEP